MLEPLEVLRVVIVAPGVSLEESEASAQEVAPLQSCSSVIATSPNSQNAPNCNGDGLQTILSKIKWCAALYQAKRAKLCQFPSEIFSWASSKSSLFSLNIGRRLLETQLKHYRLRFFPCMKFISKILLNILLK